MWRAIELFVVAACLGVGAALINKVAGEPAMTTVQYISCWSAGYFCAVYALKS
jgi:hypothetical protein